MPGALAPFVPLRNGRVPPQLSMILPTRYILGLALSCLALLGWRAGDAAAQTRTPPDFVCVRGDTLVWNDPSDPCGALNAVLVEAAGERTGPYTQIALVGPGDERYVLSAAERAGFAFFRLVASYDCAVMLSAPTVAFGAGPLPTPRIRTVDYTATGTVLTWDPADDPRVDRYIVYRETDQGTTILDTVADTTYTELLTQVEMTGAIYYLAPLDRCDGTSFNAATYSSATVAAERDACVGELRLARRLPAPWPHPFVRTVVTRETQRGARDTLRLERADSVLVVADLPPDSAYTFRVTYIDDEGGSTTTFPVSVGAVPVVTDDLLEVAELTLDPTAGWRLRWRWNPTARYDSIAWVVVRAGRTEAEGAVDPADAGVPAPQTALGLDAAFDWSDATVRVVARDACGVVRETPSARPTIGSADEVDAFTVATTWSPPLLGSGGRVFGYDLRVLDGGGGSVRVAELDGDAGTFAHDVTRVNVREVCYELIAEVELPDTLARGTQTFSWRSAPFCALRSPRVYLPTGFVPEGFSVEYRPRTSLTEGLAYRLRILDRWGKLVFETEDPFAGWDGRAGGKPAPAGAYLALVEFDEPGRATQRFETVFALVR